MHASARAHLELCVARHLNAAQPVRVVDLGSESDAAERRELFAGVSSSYEVVALPDRARATRKPYRIPLASNSVDLFVTSQTLEHIPFFWATFLEIARIVKPGGLIFVVAGSRGHQTGSSDSWRFYPDAMRSLAAFARLRLVEASTDLPPRREGSRRFDYAGIADRAYWGDTVGVFRKPQHPSKLVSGVRSALVWWANRVGGIDAVPAPKVSDARQQIAGPKPLPAALAKGDATGERTERFGMPVIRVEFDGEIYFVPDYATHRGVAKLILGGRHAEPELHDFVAKTMADRPGSMIHAGTFFGDMIPSFAAKCPGTVYAFEPVVENYLLARETVAANRVTNVRLLHAGLSNAPGMAEMETSDGTRHAGGGSKILADGSARFRPQQVPLLAIDQFEIEDLTLIQLDVEGHERFALEGARRTIERCRPVIVIEDNRRNCESYLTGLGYVRNRRVDERNTLYLPPS